jgi:dodecin
MHAEHPREATMSAHTYRVTEIVGTSHDGVDDAIRNGLHRASATLRHLDWFEVTQIRGQLENGNIEHYQIGMKVGFRIDDDE